MLAASMATFEPFIIVISAFQMRVARSTFRGLMQVAALYLVRSDSVESLEAAWHPSRRTTPTKT
jgi:hypothetical protein